MPPGSYLVISHATNDFMPPETVAGVNAAGEATRVSSQFRGRQEFAWFPDGLEVLPPGIVSVAHWRAQGEPRPRPFPAETTVSEAVARIR